METYIPISFLNDFIFCPRSIYFHQLYGSFDKSLYEQLPQIKGKASHESIDNQSYTTRKSVLMGMEVYSEVYGLAGKIDLFFSDTGELRERKRKILKLYDGYIFQLYAQYHALTEMGCVVTSLSLYDMTHNKKYAVSLPNDDTLMQQRFEQLIDAIKDFNIEHTYMEISAEKCRNCIYSNLCDRSIC